jgi:MOSC domain-containing protein YiiM
MVDTDPFGTVVAVSRDGGHAFTKHPQPSIRLIAGLGVDGDAHRGVTVQHLSRVRQDPSQPNLRQVHLLHEELFTELRARGFQLSAGTIGENITTRGLALLDLPHGARLHIGGTAVIEITGLRNPCRQLNAFQSGLMAAVLDKDAEGNLVRKAGIMAIVLADGEVRPGDPIAVEPPPPPHRPLDPV